MFKDSTKGPSKGIPKALRDLAKAGGKRKAMGPARAGELISRVVKDHGLDRQGEADRLSELWKALVGEATAKQSRVVSLKGGLLLVEVANSALAQELSVYLKRDLLRKLRSESGLTIRDLRCRVGGWS